MPEPGSSRGRGRAWWRWLTLASLLVGVGALLRKPEQAFSGRGQHGTPPARQAVAAGHEVKDINVRRTAYILTGMAAATALVVGIVFAMVWRFDVRQQATIPPFTPEQTARLVPPAPHLQRDPFADLARAQAREQHLLHSYGWITVDHRTARIPIDRAMQLTVGTSLDAGP